MAVERPSDVYRGSGGRETVGAKPPPGPSGTPGNTREDDERRERELTADLRAATGSLTAIAGDIAAAATALRSTSQDAATASLRDAENRRARDVAIARNHAAQGVLQAQARILEAQAVLGTGPATADWRSSEWPGSPAEVLAAPACLRAGTLRLTADAGVNERVEAPLLVPFLNTGNVIVRAGAKAADDVAALVQGLALRGIAATGPGQLSITVFDPLMRGILAPFRELRAGTLELLSPALSTEDELRNSLADLTRDVTRVRDVLAGRYRTLGQFREASQQPVDGYELVVLLDFPTSVSTESFELLERLIERGPESGRSFLTHLDPNVGLPRDCDLADILGACFALETDSGGFRAPALPGFEIQLDDAPPLDLVHAVTTQVVMAAREGAAPSIPFSDVVSLDGTDRASSADRMTAAIGRAGTDLVTITLGDDVEQRHNILVAGAVGQGKSNLLLVLIHSLASRYGPDELEMFLLDFKEGLEFNQLAAATEGEPWLPQARVLGLESDREFGVAVLGHLLAEFERRAALIKPHGNNISRFRAAQPDVRMPRILAVVDEFQVLLTGDDALADQALQALETLARKGRAYGIHLVLASQTLSGIQKLAMAEGSIFGQFPIRIALKNTASESQVVLSSLNTEASRLRYRGEAILNQDFGSVEGNRRVTIAKASDDDLKRLRQELWSHRPAQNASPLVFFGNRPAQIPDALQGPTGVAFLGLPVAVTQQPLGFAFAAEPGRHLAIIGDGETRTPDAETEDPLATNMAIGAIHGALISLARGGAPCRFVILDFLSAEQRARAGLDRLAMELGDAAELRVVEGSVALEELPRLSQEVERRHASPTGESVYVVALGLHRAAGLDTALDGAARTPADALRSIVKNGPVAGVHLIGWWGNLRSFTDHINYEVDGLIDGLVALKIASQDAASLFGPFVSWKPRNHRALFLDRANFDAPKTLVPFAPLGTPFPR